ncbi:MAG: hypothetical protein ABH808_02115 [Candidatus Kuenenbacteria bacterium]
MSIYSGLLSKFTLSEAKVLAMTERSLAILLFLSFKFYTVHPVKYSDEYRDVLYLTRQTL